MAVSLAVLLVPIAVLITFYRLVFGADEPAVVDTRPAVADARAANAFTVAEPTGLPEHWRPTSATFRRSAEGATLRIGYVGPDQDPAQLVESNITVDRLFPAELGAGAHPSGDIAVGGRTWQRYDTLRNEAALVLLEPGRTIIVIGKSEPEQLAEVAAALT